jgi:hypothetical protein
MPLMNFRRIATAVAIGLVAAWSLVSAVATAAAPLKSAAETKLLASDGSSFDFFGDAVALSGNVAVVGAPTAGPKGAAYVFERTGSAWTEVAKLTGAGATGNANFGFSVAIAGHWILVGAPADSYSGVYQSGSVYAFRRTGGQWSQASVLLPPDASAQQSFGLSVAIAGPTAVAGAIGDADNGPLSGAAYVFDWRGAWQPTQKLTPGDGAADDRFGQSVSLSGGTLLVGAYRDDDTASNSGSAYTFTRRGNRWEEGAKLLANDGASGAAFGYSVALGGDLALVGAPFHGSGAAYAFERRGNRWEQAPSIVGSDSAAGDQFGRAVGIQGGTLLVGAPNASEAGISGGAAYSFVRARGAWTESAKLTASDAANGDNYGISVAPFGTTALVGAWAQGDNGTYGGAVYVEALR